MKPKGNKTLAQVEKETGNLNKLPIQSNDTKSLETDYDV
jgi:hypothetical protein